MEMLAHYQSQSFKQKHPPSKPFKSDNIQQELLKNQDKSLKYDLDDLLRQMVKKLNQNESSQL
jgi:hypothetical protein